LAFAKALERLKDILGLSAPNPDEGFTLDPLCFGLAKAFKGTMLVFSRRSRKRGQARVRLLEVWRRKPPRSKSFELRCVQVLIKLFQKVCGV